MNKRTVLFTFLILLAAVSIGFAGGDPVSCESHGQSAQACEGATAEGNYCLSPAGAAPSVETIGKCKYKMEGASVTPQCRCVVNQAPTRNTPLIS